MFGIDYVFETGTSGFPTKSAPAFLSFFNQPRRCLGKFSQKLRTAQGATLRANKSLASLMEFGQWEMMVQITMLR